MSRIPACLLYLAVYNPTLQLKQPVDEHDEDAEEQAHILFYTSKERAVSRDRMLRQIGLAKALVNFSELFNPNDKCESIHSQSRRMVLVSPEPNFWINAAVELPKRLQKPAPSKGGSKGKPKSGGSGNGAATTKLQDGAQEFYEYDDGTVHDIALRSRLMHAYERFKLLHGSFTSVLAELGQEALELQLERFFTVWAWSWNLEAKPQIAEQLGLPLQPYYGALIPLLDAYSADLPETVVPVILSRTHIIPSNRYVLKEYPSALAEHLMSMIPPTSHTEDPLASSVDTIQPRDAADSKSNSSGLFGLPAVNMNMAKWNWQGYLTFGKSGGSSSKSTSEASKDLKDDQKEVTLTEIETPDKELKTEESEPPKSSPRSSLEVEVDAKALEDALSSEGVLPPGQPEVEKGGEEVEVQRHEVHSRDDTDRPSLKRSASLEDDIDSRPLLIDGVTSSPQSSMTILPRRRNQAPSTRSPSPPPLPSFAKCQVYLAISDDLAVTQKQEVHYHIRNGMMLGLLGVDAPEFSSSEAEEMLVSAAQNATEMLDEVELTIQNAALAKLSESYPSANKILQTPDQYAISTDQYVVQNPGFASDSSHLQNAATLLDKDPDILEVFARGQNPQYWHVAKRGLSSGAHESAPSEASGLDALVLRGRAFLEVFKKEASLPDVDNVLVGVLKKSGAYKTLLSVPLPDENSPDYQAALLYKARSHIALNDPQSALKLVPEDTENVALKAVASLARYIAATDSEDKEAALEELRDLSVEIEDDAEGTDREKALVRVLAGTAFAKAGEVEEALETLGTETEDLEAVAVIVQIYLSIHRTDLAKKQFDRSKRWAEDDLLLQLIESNIGLVTGKDSYSNAQSFYTEQLANPSMTSPHLLTARGVTRLLRNEIQEAKSDLEEALQQNKDDAETLAAFVVAGGLGALKKNETEEYWSQLTSKYPEHPLVVDVNEKADSFDQLLGSLTLPPAITV